MIVDPRYQRGKIYTIRSHITPLVYVGSTIEPRLSNRLGAHRRNYKQYKNNTSRYCTSYDIFEVDENCYIELYENYPCENKAQLDRREGEVIRELDCCNKVVAGRTRGEHYQDNKGKIREREKKYYEINPEKAKMKSKKYYDKNKDKIAAKGKIYRDSNKEKIKARKNQKSQCECGSIYRRSDKLRHFRTKKHREYMDFMYN